MKLTWQAALGFVAKVMIEAADNPAQFKHELAKAGFEADGFSKHTAEPWKLDDLSASAVPN